MELYLQAETTGRHPHRGHIIEAAAVVLDDLRREIASFEILANPGAEALREADPELMRVHEITETELAGAPRPEIAATELDVFLDRFRDARLHSYNNDSCRTLFSTAPWRLGIRKWGESVRAAAAEIMILPEDMSAGRMPKLGEAMQFFGLSLAGPRRALTVARAVARLHGEIIGYHLENDVNEDEAFHMFEHGL